MNAHRIIRSSVLFVFTVVLAVALPWLLTGHGPVARAATLQVCPAACPYTTIQAAVTAASSGDTINIGEGTYPEHVVVGSKVLTFVGAGASSTFVDGTNNGRVFSVTAASATFADLTIQNGKVISDSGGGIYANGALTLTDVAVLNNRSESRLVGGNVDGGGGVRVLGALSVTGGRFENNAVPTPLGEGGAIRSNAAAAPHPSVTISGTVFISNTAKYGGAVSAGGTTRITNTQVASNTATAGGGGVYVGTSSPSVTLSGCTIEHNTTLDGRGGGANIAGTDLMISGSIIQHNTTITGTGGGGVYVVYGLTVTGTQFIGNRAEHTEGAVTGSGGGLYAVNYASARTVVDTDFISNTAGQYGGGFYTGGGPVTLTNTRFISNTSYLVGGGARLTGAAKVVDSEFTSNSAISSTGGSGGGLYLDSTATVTGTEFTSNWSGNLGGGLYAFGAATLTNSQFTGNSAAAGGGAYFYGAATLVDAPFADNTATNDGGGLFARASLLMTDTQLIRNRAANGGGIYISGNTAGASRMVNVLLAANSAITNGAALYLYSAGSGSTARSATIVHTTIASPTVGASQAIFVGKPATYTPTVNITNTIIANYAAGIVISPGVTLTSDYNLFFNAPSNISIGSHSIMDVDPYFIDPAGGDYHIGPDSPAVNAGVAAGVATDFDGDIRPQWLGYDIGYDELVSHQCGLSTGLPYIFGSPAMTITFSNLGNIACAAWDYFPRAQPYATGITGHGAGADHFWQIAARDSGGGAATGFTAILTATVPGGFTNPKLCFYPGALGGDGWDCGGTDNGDGTVSRTTTHFSDWAVGGQVGPTAVTLKGLTAAVTDETMSLLLFVGVLAVSVLGLSLAWAIGLDAAMIIRPRSRHDPRHDR